ncbi:MAG: hypothetical protein II670_06805 [Alphaproteobacteria bacterium]|nr:hypothetical protein [Alphaproteobacteria bacterium]
MFNRNTRQRKKLEDGTEEVNYKEKLADLLFFNTDKYRINKDTAQHLPLWRNFYKRYYDKMEPKHFKKIYETLIFGDPKKRMLVTMSNIITGEYRDRTKKHHV